MSADRPVHSPIGASSRYRFSKCPGSVALSKGMPNTSGIAAQEGTAAHELISLAMQRAFSKNIKTIDVLNDIVKAVDVYADYVEGIKQGHAIHIEHSFDMGAIFEDLYGTADCVVYNQKSSTLHVIDYKHGENLVVEVEGNGQLEYYALGALTTLGYPCRWVHMTIVQPRAYHPDGPIRHWKVPALHFIDVENKIVAEAKETLEKDALLLAGSHCMFCPAKTVCPQKAKANVTGAKSDFKFYKDPKEDFAPI